MSKLELIELIALAVIALVLAIYYIIKAIKNHWVEKITKTINEAIKYAENNIEGGLEKKKYVLDQVEKECYELGIPYTLIKKIISKLIDKTIEHYNVIKK